MVMRFEAHLECLPGSTQVRQHHGLDAGEEVVGEAEPLEHKGNWDYQSS